MTKEQILDIIKLLSALEAWSFAEKHRLPDYLLEDLDKTMTVLSDEVMGGSKEAIEIAKLMNFSEKVKEPLL